MPIKIAPANITIPFRIFQASSFFSRLVGLLGTYTPLDKCVLVFTGCRSVHTFGMMYPIDVVFVNKSGRVLDFANRLQPSKVLKGPDDTHAVLEFPPGSLVEHNIFPGSVLDIRIDAPFPASVHGILRVLNRPVNIALSVLLVYISVIRIIYNGGFVNIADNIASILYLMFALSLFITRIPRTVSNRFTDWTIPALSDSVFLFLFCSTLSLKGSLPYMLLTYPGVIIYSLALVSIGRNYGILPSRRKISLRGLYRFLRHPMYASEALILSGLLAHSYSHIRAILVVMVILMNIWRALREEQILGNVPEYIIYRRFVRYRFVPGLL